MTLGGWLVAVCVALPAVGFLVSGCGEPKGMDAVSGATTKAFPPKADTYEVVGWQEGLNGYVVKYNDRMYRGGDVLDRKGAQALKQWGVRTIVSVTPTDVERQLAREYGMTLVEVPFEKTPGPAPETLARFLEATRAGPGAFYVHCHGGTHRGGILCASYRMREEGWDFNKTAVEFGRLGGDLKADHAMLEAVRKHGKAAGGR